MGTIPSERLERFILVAHHIVEPINVTFDIQRPYIGAAALTHKTELRNEFMRRADAYEYVPLDSVGNCTRVVVNDVASRTTFQMKAVDFGLEVDSPAFTRVLGTLKPLENTGYHFEAADGSLKIMMRAAARAPLTGLGNLFGIESYRVITGWRVSHSEAENEIQLLVHPWS